MMDDIEPFIVRWRLKRRGDSVELRIFAHRGAGEALKLPAACKRLARATNTPAELARFARTRLT
jgi:hypothetical protein